jgi:hypothetical protein
MNETALDPAALDAAARLVGEADALLVCAGAGMGVDSGLPDFRSNDGFWKAYPPYARGSGCRSSIWLTRRTSTPIPSWQGGFYGPRLGRCARMRRSCGPRRFNSRLACRAKFST